MLFCPIACRIAPRDRGVDSHPNCSKNSISLDKCSSRKGLEKTQSAPAAIVVWTKEEVLDHDARKKKRNKSLHKRVLLFVLIYINMC